MKKIKRLSLAMMATVVALTSSFVLIAAEESEYYVEENYFYLGCCVDVYHGIAPTNAISCWLFGCIDSGIPQHRRTSVGGDANHCDIFRVYSGFLCGWTWLCTNGGSQLFFSHYDRVPHSWTFHPGDPPLVLPCGTIIFGAPPRSTCRCGAVRWH